MNKEELLDPGCLCLPEEYASETDFQASEAIEIDMSEVLPDTYSLGSRIYQTSNQGKLGSCTSVGTTHAVQILNVKKGGVIPNGLNIITPKWQDLWSKMGHSTTTYDGGDYVEKAVSTALKEGILIEENGQLARFDAYATDSWRSDDASIDKMKRYIYKGCPIVWCVKGDGNMWREMREGHVKTIPATTTGGHAIALVGWDKTGMRFINSRTANDENKLKSRFHIEYSVMKKLGGLLNFRYRVLYMEKDAQVDPEYLKRKNNALLILKALKECYPKENSDVKKAIEKLSQEYRKAYPEINNDLPLN